MSNLEACPGFFHNGYMPLKLYTPLISVVGLRDRDFVKLTLKSLVDEIVFSSHNWVSMSLTLIYYHGPCNLFSYIKFKSLINTIK